MENFKYGQTSPQASHSGENQADKLQAESKSSMTSGAQPVVNEKKVVSSTANSAPTNASKNAPQKSTGLPSEVAPGSSTQRADADQSVQGAHKSENSENSQSPPNSQSAGNTPSSQPGQSAISMAATGKRIGGGAVLPGESGEKYFQGLASAIDELGAKSITQIYLAEKFFQCIWSMNRYETQKRACLLAEMVKALKDEYLVSKEERRNLTLLLEAGMWDSPAIQSRLKSSGYTSQSITQRAMERRMEELMQLDQLIALKANTLSGIQKSYEALVARSVMQERLKLQNELLKRDLQAIDVPVLEGNSGSGVEDVVNEAQDKPPNFVRKSTIPASAFDMDADEKGLAPSDVTPKFAKSKGTRKRKAAPPVNTQDRFKD